MNIFQNLPVSTSVKNFKDFFLALSREAPCASVMLDHLYSSWAAVTHLEVDDGEAVPVQPADDGVEVLKPGGQEGSEGPLQSYSTSLLEAHEVCTSNSSHVTSLGGVQGNQVQLEEKNIFIWIEIFILSMNEVFLYNISSTIRLVIWNVVFFYYCSSFITNKTLTEWEINPFVNLNLSLELIQTLIWLLYNAKYS